MNSRKRKEFKEFEEYKEFKNAGLTRPSRKENGSLSATWVSERVSRIFNSSNSLNSSYSFYDYLTS